MDVRRGAFRRAFAARLAVGPAAAVALLVPVGAGHAQDTPAKPPSYTAAQALRGQEAYEVACAMCHGDALDDGEFAPPLKGSSYVRRWREKSAEDVLIYMNGLMPPSQPGLLGLQGYADIMAYMLQSAGAPAGDKEVPADPAQLTTASPY